MVLAVESVAVVAAAAVVSGTPPGPHALPEAAPAGRVLAESGTNDPGVLASSSTFRQAACLHPRSSSP